MITLLIAAVGKASAETVAAGPAGERKFFAHYMGCFPGVGGWLPVALTNDTAKMRAPERFEQPGGGGWVDRPLLPWGYHLDAVAGADVEIQRAMRAGLDGFSVDAWAGSGTCKATFEALMQAAEKYNGRFQITICLDPACHSWTYEGKDTPMWQRFADSVNYVLKYKDSPAFAKFDGLPLIFTYHARFIVGREPPEKVAEAWRKFRAAVPEKIFLHGDVDYLVKMDDPKCDRLAVARFGTDNFEAVGAFIASDGNWGLDREMAAAVTKAGKVWSQPMCGQYQNFLGGIITGKGLDRLAAAWENARATDSRLIQYVTWNDYGEETSLAPTYSTSYTLTRLCRHWAEWWKTGKEPIPEKDEVHLIARRYTDYEKPSRPFSSRTLPDGPEPMLEVATLLTAPATVQVKDYGSYDAPAGLFRKQFPLHPGILVARVQRKVEGELQTVAAVKAPEIVVEGTFREDFMLYAYGSNFKEEWERDFPGIKPIKVAFNADQDGDGMANWFEMLYFGEWNNLATVSVADPSADPDGDGFTNLQEFERRTNPLVADRPYPAGYIWNSVELAKKQFVWNPLRDEHGNDVWYLLRANGQRVQISGGQVKTRWFYDGNCVLASNGVVRIGGHRGDAYAFAWRAPVAGTYEIAAEVGVPESGHEGGCIHARLAIPGVKEREVTLVKGKSGTLEAAKVKLRAGDFVKVISDLRDMWGIGPLEIRSFKIVLTQAEEVQ